MFHVKHILIPISNLDRYAILVFNIVLTRSTKQNLMRFPEGFLFQLTEENYDI